MEEVLQKSKERREKGQYEQKKKRKQKDTVKQPSSEFRKYCIME